ncbi:unnamed protein product [Dovyalis caffra]|uniref:F-box associated beta-propeller type 3 domain-containing protein n=1 Tax=Dovyalis caffra TaxID=77055 RepID=A0AAV1R6G2_9ROSI|nr:unnamed protein product [Dovyalis caffra]
MEERWGFLPWSGRSWISRGVNEWFYRKKQSNGRRERCKARQVVHSTTSSIPCVLVWLLENRLGANGNDETITTLPNKDNAVKEITQDRVPGGAHLRATSKLIGAGNKHQNLRLISFGLWEAAADWADPSLSCFRPYPPCEDGVRLHANLSGLGFDPKTEKFKVLRFTYPLGMAMGAFSVEHLKAEVCTLGNTTWRSIAQHQQFVRSHFHSDNFNVFMNGSLHRIADHEGVRQICAFDCESEQFKSILLPSVFSVEDDLDFVLQNVGALGDSLHLCLLVENFQQNVLEVWLMKEYGIVESWTKIVVFENILEPLNDWIPPAVIKVFGNGDLLFYRRPYVFLYKSKTNGLTKLDSDRIQSTMKPIDHRPSFASLNDLVRDNSSI